MLVCTIFNRWWECDAVHIFNHPLSADCFQLQYAKKLFLREYYIVNILKWYLLLNCSCVPILYVTFYKDYDHSEELKRNILLFNPQGLFTHSNILCHLVESQDSSVHRWVPRLNGTDNTEWTSWNSSLQELHISQTGCFCGRSEKCTKNYRLLLNAASIKLFRIHIFGLCRFFTWSL
jgi:hypothetical protein